MLILGWSFGVVGVLGTLFFGLLLLSRKWRVPTLIGRTGIFVLWVAAATLIIWLLFVHADAQAAARHQRNVGMAVVYIYLWLLVIIPAPALGVALSYFLKHGECKF
jgi:hypothetical protein